MRARHIDSVPPRAFTLTELLVAVVILIGVFLGVGKMFSTSGRIVSVGEATADVLVESIAIEKRLRTDLAKLSHEGVFVIRCVSVPNDLYLPGGGLLNPALPPDAVLRADQLLFFTNGVGSVQTYPMGDGSSHRGQGTFSRVYFGHAFQLGEAGRPAVLTGAEPMTIDPLRARSLPPNDPNPNTTCVGPFSPWWRGGADIVRTNMDASSPNVFDFVSAGTAKLPPLDARKWLLAYQPAILARDGAGLEDYLEEVMVCRSIFLEEASENSRQLMQGRLDAAASRYDNIRTRVLFTGSQPHTWPQQRDVIAGIRGNFQLPGLIYYPRAERYAPSMSRLDQALTNHVISVGCSSVKIDWTYAEGVGEIRDADGNVVTDSSGNPLWPGIRLDSNLALGSREEAQPWFGMEDSVSGVFNYADYDGQATTIFAENVERPVDTPHGSVQVYEAVFGYNQDVALNAAGNPHVDLGYTPWPSAIRITVTLHDAQTNLVHGREVQFTVRLPGRGDVSPSSF